MTIGTGFAGGSSLSENLSPRHLVQFVNVAYNREDAELFGNFESVDPFASPAATSTSVRPVPLSLSADASDLRQTLRQIILEELNAVLTA